MRAGAAHAGEVEAELDRAPPRDGARLDAASRPGRRRRRGLDGGRSDRRGRRDGDGRRERGGRRRRRRLAVVDMREHFADRNLLADRHDDVDDPALGEGLDLDGALLRLDDGDDAARSDRVARLDQPFDQRARFHIGAERRHFEVDHVGLTSSRAAAAMPAACGRHASSRCGA